MINKVPHIPLAGRGTKPVRYEDIRGLLRTGDLLGCSGNGVFSKLIKEAQALINKKTTDRELSHIAFIYRLDMLDRIMVFESVESIGVRPVTLSSYLRDYNGTGKGYDGELYIYRHCKFDEVRPEVLRVASQKAVDLFGHQYDNGEIAKIAQRIIMSKLGVDYSGKKLERDNEYICSEYVYEFYRGVGLRIEYDLGIILPADYDQDPSINFMWRLKVI